MSESSLSLLFDLGLQSHLGRLCKLINKTLLSPTQDFLPIIPTGHYTNLELSCENLVPVVESCIPWLFTATLIVTFLSVYLVYYQWVIVGKPKVVCHDTARMHALSKHCPVFFEKYRPTLWAPHAYMQTIFRVAIQTFPKQERRRYVKDQSLHYVTGRI